MQVTTIDVSEVSATNDQSSATGFWSRCTSLASGVSQFSLRAYDWASRAATAVARTALSNALPTLNGWADQLGCPSRPSNPTTSFGLGDQAYHEGMQAALGAV